MADNSFPSPFRARALALEAVVALLLLPSVVRAQVAGSSLIGVAAAEVRKVAYGWSARHRVLGSAVFNEKKERIGTIEDIIIDPDQSVSYVIVGAGGFLGVAKHDVAIPVSQLSLQEGNLVLTGGSRAALKAMPEFEYGAPTG